MIHDHYYLYAKNKKKKNSEDAYTWAWAAAPWGSVPASVPQDATLAWTQLLAHTHPEGQGASKPKNKIIKKVSTISIDLFLQICIYVSFLSKISPFTRALLAWAFLECNHTVYPHSAVHIQIAGGTQGNILRLAAWQFLLSWAFREADNLAI